MTPAELALCRAIAEKDGWTFREGNYFCCWKSPGAEKFNRHLIPDYLTDPAETVRMSEELIKAKYYASYILYDKGMKLWWWHHRVGGGISADTYERATAESYKAMEPRE